MTTHGKLHGDMKLVDVTVEFAKGLDVFRLKDGGFQRSLDTRRLPEMVRVLTDGAMCPPIVVAVIGEKRLLIDGQHRFAAWSMTPFPLKATVVHMKSMNEAREAFSMLNREQRKIGLTHIIKVSSADYAVRTRRMADECKVSIPHIHNLMTGITNTKNPLKSDVTEKHWALAAKTMSFWMKGKRWGGSTSYNSCGTLKLLGFFVQKAAVTGTVESMLKDLASLDYSNAGPLGRVAGSSFAAQAKMKAVVYKTIAERVI